MGAPVSGAALVSVGGNKSSKLDLPAQPDEIVTAADVTDPLKLSRLLTRILSELTRLRRRFAPKRTTFRDIVATGDMAAPYTVRLSHYFGGRVEWWIVGVSGFDPAQFGPQGPLAQEAEGTDANTLVLHVYANATFAVRVEEGG